jgi:hypothetical protein
MPQLFVGVWPPPKIAKALAAYPHGDADGWSSPSQWLVNVRPLGRVHPETVPALVDALAFELDGMPKPTAALQPPRHGEWLRVEVLGLDELRDVVFEATTPIVPITHPRSVPWTPVVPLRRDRSPKELVHPLSGSWAVGEVVLAAGTRSKAGHGYETVASFPLG